MSWSSIYYPILGGSFIGISVTLMLLFNGRVTGISGIVASSLSFPSRNDFWRPLFLLGMILGGASTHFIYPELFLNMSGRSAPVILVAGFLVGYGTVMGSGCTSGHGICGISRLSIRSVIATLTFMLFGFMTVQLFNYFIGSSL